MLYIALIILSFPMKYALTRTPVVEAPFVIFSTLKSSNLLESALFSKNDESMISISFMDESKYIAEPV